MYIKCSYSLNRPIYIINVRTYMYTEYSMDYREVSPREHSLAVIAPFRRRDGPAHARDQTNPSRVYIIYIYMRIYMYRLL